MRGKKRRLGERKVGILAGINLFGGCSGEELAALADLFEEIERPAGCVIVREGEPGDAFYVIIDGTATATVGEQYVGSLSPGDFFGEMSLLERAPRAATITGS